MLLRPKDVIQQLYYNFIQFRTVNLDLNEIDQSLGL